MANAECFRNVDDDIREKCEQQAKDAYETFRGPGSNEIINKEHDIDQSCV